MQTTSANITYTPASDEREPSLRLTLEPENVEAGRNRATLADIDAMLAMARSGASARNRQISRCGWASWAANGDLICTLSLWVWPSELDLTYSLTLPSGVTSAEPVLVRERRDTKLWVAGSGGTLELPWLLESASCVWHGNIGVWDGWSRPAAPPAISLDRARLILDGERGASGVYGVLAVQGMAVGWRHEISIRYPTGTGKDDADDSGDSRFYVAVGGDATAPGISVRNADDIDVTATWTDERGETREETARLAIPDCVKALLEECPTGARTGSIRVKPADGTDGPVVVYYNACNGRMLDVRREEARP